MYIKKEDSNETIDRFHQLYYNSWDSTWKKTYFLGVPIFKCPLDLWIYQEIIFAVKPELIIETGTALGGSALYFATLCDTMRHGSVVSIDIEKHPPVLPRHARIRYLHGSSTSAEMINTVKGIAKGKERILVILDSDHHKEHVYNELVIYSPLVSVGSYIIVEDTNINGHPVYSEFGEGPREAVEDFLSKRSSYVVDREMEKFYLTFNPAGYLKRVFA